MLQSEDSSEISERANCTATAYAVAAELLYLAIR
jgi:hypothetical protein